MVQVTMPRKIIISKEAFLEMEKIREELDSVVETIGIMNNKKLMEGIKRSKEDVKSGRVTKLESVDNLFGE